MPPRRANPKGYERARKLRKELTPAEQKLWAYLRGNKLHRVNFRRQHAIGRYIVDFVSIKNKLVIELDGSQHLEQEERDTERTQFLELQDIRFWNDKVMNDIEGVVQAIEIMVKDG
jgi:very-short-patch-repair endonuclease